MPNHAMSIITSVNHLSMLRYSFDNVVCELVINVTFTVIF